MYIRKALLALVLVCALSAPVLAQDATPEVTAEPTPPVVEVPADDTVTLPSWVLVNLSVLLVAASSFVAIGGMLLTNRNLKQTLEHTSKANKDAIEAAHEALPETAQDTIDRVLGALEFAVEQIGAGLKFAREVTDGNENVGQIVDQLINKMLEASAEDRQLR